MSTHAWIFHAVARTDLAEAEGKRLPVIVGDKPVIDAIAAGHHIVNSAWIFEPELPSHTESCFACSKRARFL